MSSRHGAEGTAAGEQVSRAGAVTASRPAGAGRRPVLPVLVASGVIGLLLLAGGRLAPALGAFTTWVAGLGAWGPLVFVAAYAAATVAFVPGSVLTLAAGALFGLGPGVLLVFAGAVLGASAAFLVARYVARGAVERRLAADARFLAIDRAVRAEGRRIVLLLRLSPVFPFNLLNYALGLTGVRFVDYLAASVGMLPGTVLYVYLGKIGGDAAVAAGGSGTADLGTWTVRLLGLAATVAVTLVVTRTARHALARATGV